VKAAAQTFRSNPKLNVEEVITQLGVGEALVSLLDEKGIPGVVERAMICPPHSQIGAITPEQRAVIIKSSIVAGIYETPVDRESAYEKLKGKVAASTAAAAPGAGGSNAGTVAQEGGWLEAAGSVLGGVLGGSGGSRRGDTVVEAMVKSAARSMGSTVGRQIVRGVLGSLLGGTSSRRR
jgi:DNA helicase HerA-like ATPase